MSNLVRKHLVVHPIENLKECWNLTVTKYRSLVSLQSSSRRTDQQLKTSATSFHRPVLALDWFLELPFICRSSSIGRAPDLRSGCCEIVTRLRLQQKNVTFQNVAQRIADGSLVCASRQTMTKGWLMKGLELLLQEGEPP